MRHINKNRAMPAGRQGQTIIEAMIALASILLTLAAISVAITTSVSNSQFIKDQTLASQYAQDGMEYMRYLRNTNPSSFESREGIYCLNQDNSFSAGTCGAVNIGSVFKREAEFTQNSLVECNGGTKAVVRVYWSSGKCDVSSTFCHKSELISCFANQSASGTQL